MSPTARMGHRGRGLAGIRSIKALEDGLNDAAGIEQLANRLSEIHRRIQAAPRQFLIIGESEHCDGYRQQLTARWGERDSAAPVNLTGCSQRGVSGNPQTGYILNSTTPNIWG